MRPLNVRLREAAKRNKVILDVIEKDYAQSYVLAGLMSQPVLKETLVFKGGTALKKNVLRFLPVLRRSGFLGNPGA